MSKPLALAKNPKELRRKNVRPSLSSIPFGFLLTLLMLIAFWAVSLHEDEERKNTKDHWTPQKQKHFLKPDLKIPPKKLKKRCHSHSTYLAPPPPPSAPLDRWEYPGVLECPIDCSN
jgi:hypothetical protein